MTHIVHPYSHRLGVIRDWKSRWFATNPKQYRDFLRVDTTIRQFLTRKLRGMYVSTVEIERSSKTLRVIVKTSRPGLIIGRSGEGSVKLIAALKRKNIKLDRKILADLAQHEPQSVGDI